jgi:hypothetical protein
MCKISQEDFNEIKHNEVYCSTCQQKIFSLFDKLYCVIYNKCVDCDSEADIERNSEPIFKAIQDYG